jgi:predicted nucleic acid-binding protein
MLDSTAAVAAERQGKNALQLGYGVGTANVRHFEQIPGLKVVRL